MRSRSVSTSFARARPLKPAPAHMTFSGRLEPRGSLERVYASSSLDLYASVASPCTASPVNIPCSRCSASMIASDDIFDVVQLSNCFSITNWMILFHTQRNYSFPTILYILHRECFQVTFASSPMAHRWCLAASGGVSIESISNWGSFRKFGGAQVLVATTKAVPRQRSFRSPRNKFGTRRTSNRYASELTWIKVREFVAGEPLPNIKFLAGIV